MNVTDLVANPEIMNLAGIGNIKANVISANWIQSWNLGVIVFVFAVVYYDLLRRIRKLEKRHNLK